MTSLDVPINPDCLAGKHAACTGDAWDMIADDLTICACTCHRVGL